MDGPTPFCLFVGGAPAAGKTTFARRLQAAGLCRHVSASALIRAERAEQGSSRPRVKDAAGSDEDEPAGYLGDIALCPQVAAQQAPAAGHSTKDEIELLTVHGLLHLLGYDHATPDEHSQMFGIQSRLLLEWQSGDES